MAGAPQDREIGVMTPEKLRAYLEAATGRRITLRINDNIRTMVSCQQGKRRGELRASIHRIFLDAPLEVRRALARFLVEPDSATRRIVREYIALHTEAPDSPLPINPRPPGNPVGEYYDLEPIAKRLNERYFGGRLVFTIEWGRRVRQPRRRISRMTLGACYRAQRLIRIHPILDSQRVPLFYLEYILFHEMAHLEVPARRGADGRQLNHTAEFYALERSYPRYREAVAWQELHFDRLLSAYCRRRGTGDPDQTRTTSNGQLDLFAWATGHPKLPSRALPAPRAQKRRAR